MAYRKFTINIDLNSNELQNAVLHRVDADPMSPAQGQVWFNSIDKLLKTYDGVNIKAIGEIEFQETATHLQWRLKGDSVWHNAYLKPVLHSSQEFVNATEVLMTHNMAKFPSVTVVDTANTVYEAAVEYIDTNNVRVQLNSPISGKVYCN